MGDAPSVCVLFVHVDMGIVESLDQETETVITERRIQLAIYADKSGASQIICPNYTPAGWWECDLWQVTKAGYAVEYEIKLSLSDFKIDAKKTQRRFENSNETEKWKIIDENKHDLLSDRCERGPSRFFYCIPDELIDQIHPILPAWAGLLSFKHSRLRYRSARRIIKDAPKLHKVKVCPREIELCKDRVMFRYWHALAKIDTFDQRG